MRDGLYSGTTAKARGTVYDVQKRGEFVCESDSCEERKMLNSAKSLR